MITQKLQSLIPAGAGTQVYEIWGSGWRVSFAVARDQGWLPDCLERGTSPYIGLGEILADFSTEVFDRAGNTFVSRSAQRPLGGLSTRSSTFRMGVHMDSRHHGLMGAHSRTNTGNSPRD